MLTNQKKNVVVIFPTTTLLFAFLFRWVNLGVEALIFDDGLDFDDVERMTRNRVTVQDLLEALDEKYDILREKLLWEAVKTHIGE